MRDFSVIAVAEEGHSYIRINVMELLPESWQTGN